MKFQRQTAPCADCTPTTSACECEGRGCEKCGITTMVRSRFFPGQLLVDGDLQLLVDYAATKDRLHNRFLHGAGVVCGLLVRCHPCGGGQVVVEPGMALDCCGNDIIVPCPVELDINAMVRDLRLKQLAGYDCGDPCGKNAEPGDPERNLRRYDLYVRYCEEHTDPVTPYTSDDDCASVECEFTRIREGYSFELRCPEDEECPPTMWDKIRLCIDDLELADRSADDANALSQFSEQTQLASARIRNNEAPSFEEADQQLLVEGTDQLTNFVASADQADEGATSAIEEIEVRRVMDTLRTVSAAIVRFDLLPSKEKKAAEERMSGVKEQVEKARKDVQSAQDPLKAAVNRIQSRRDRELAVDGIEQATLWISSELTEEQSVSKERQFFAYNVSTSAKSMQLMSDTASQLRDWLLREIEKRGLFADCRLRDEVLKVRIPDRNGTSPETLAAVSFTLVHAFIRYLIDCICAALNPPCAPCEESAVKLTAVEVEDCEVIRICNLERTYVLSWPAMRYWIPFLCEIGNAFESICCEFAKRLERPRSSLEQSRDFNRTSSYYVNTAPTARILDDQPAIANVLQFANISPESAKSAVNIGGNLSAILNNEPVLDMEGKARALARSGALQLTAELLAAAGPATGPAPDEVARKQDQMDVGKLASKVDALIDDVGKRLKPESLGRTKVIRELREELKTQRSANEALKKQVDKLQEARDE